MPRLSPPRSKRVSVPEPGPGEATPTDEEVVIELSDDDLDGLTIDVAEHAEPEPVKTESEPEPPPEPNPDEAVRRAVEAQRRAEDIARNAQRERDEAVRNVERERGDREDAQYNGVLTAIAAEQATLDKAESDYAAYLAASDTVNAAKAMRVLSTASARLDRLEDAKVGLDQARAAPKTPEKVEQRREPATLEQQISAMPVPDNAKAWLRTHPELVTDNAKNSKLGVAHRYITEVKGVAQFSPAYFEALEAEMGFRKAPDAKTPEPQPQQRRSIPVTAPVSRDVPTSSGERQTPTSVTLSPEEVRIAHNSFGPINNGKDLTNAEKEKLYALNKMKLARLRANGSYPSRERA